MRQIKELAGVIHDMELRAQKLGRDLGDLVPRSALEGPARQMAYQLMRCADAVVDQLGKALIGRDQSQPITVQEVKEIAEPILLNAYVLQPMVQASNGDNPGAPPPWLVSVMKEGINEVLEEEK